MNWNDIFTKVVVAVFWAIISLSPGPVHQIVHRVREPVGQATAKPVQAAWQKDPEVSWYGPGFYGKRTACGLAYTKTIRGVAHRTLPCGTLVTFRWAGKEATVPVIDRGPYVKGRSWDLSGGLCVYLEHCFTGPIEWRLK